MFDLPRAQRGLNRAEGKDSTFGKHFPSGGANSVPISVTLSAFERWPVFPEFPAFDFTDCSDHTDSNDWGSSPEAESRAVGLATERGGKRHVELAKSTFSESIQDRKCDCSRLFPDIGRQGNARR